MSDSRRDYARHAARRPEVVQLTLTKGRWTPVEEIDARLTIKVGKMMGSVGEKGLQKLGKVRRAYRDEIFQTLKSGRVYVLGPRKQFVRNNE